MVQKYTLFLTFPSDNKIEEWTKIGISKSTEYTDTKLNFPHALTKQGDVLYKSREWSIAAFFFKPRI